MRNLSNGCRVAVWRLFLLSPLHGPLFAEAEAEEDAAEKAHCDEEITKVGRKKAEMPGEIEKFTTKNAQDACKSIGLKYDVKELPSKLEAHSEEQAKMDKIRNEHSDYVEAKEDLERGVGGLQKALEKVRAHYGGAAFVQNSSSDVNFIKQPAMQEKNTKYSGAGQRIIGILKHWNSEDPCSDFSKNLAKSRQSLTSSPRMACSHRRTRSPRPLRNEIKYKVQDKVLWCGPAHHWNSEELRSEFSKNLAKDEPSESDLKCDEEIAKVETKKAETPSEIEKFTTKIAQDVGKSTGLKDDVKELPSELEAHPEEQAEMDEIRNEHTDYVEAKEEDPELAVDGLQKALEKFQAYYYDGAACVQNSSSDMNFMKQPASQEKNTKSSGAGQRIIGILKIRAVISPKILRKRSCQSLTSSPSMTCSHRRTRSPNWHEP